MKKILLATTLLSIAMSENILLENYLRPKTVWIRGKQFGNKEIKRAQLNEISSDMKEFSNYDDNRQLPRISDTQFISDSRKLPSLTYMRPSDLALLPQVERLSSGIPKLDNVAKPTVLISIDIQEGKNVNDISQKDCSRIKNHRKHNHGWQIQQPFYVEEPRWINIYPDMDGSERLYKDTADPYILSRGKKIFRIKDTEQAEKTAENYENFPNEYPNRLSTKYRVRRSVVMNEKSQNNTINDNQKDQKKEINYYDFLQDADSNNIAMIKSQDKKSYKIDKISENKKSEEDTSSIHDTFIKKYQKDKIKNVTVRLPYEFESVKQNQTSANDEKIINFVEQNQNVQHENTMSNHIKNDDSKIAKINQDKKFNNRESFFPNMNKRNKRSIPLKNKNFSEVRKKYKTQKIDTSVEKNVKRNETDVYEQNKAYIDKLDDLDTYNDDTFTLSSEEIRLDNKAKSSNKEDTDRNKSIERPWKIQYYVHRKNFESEEESRDEKNEPEIDKNDIEATDSQLINKLSDSESPRIKNDFNYRKKRNTCEICKIKPQLQEELLKDIEREILQDSLSLERRNKNSNILEDLTLHEPYVISRGKKASHEFENSIYWTLESPNVDNADRTKVTSLPLEKALLRMLLMELSRCNNCDINVNRLPNKRSSRNRRGLFDEIFTVYDPYYLVRGKRINLDKFLIKMRSLRNQKNASFETADQQ